LRLNRSVIKIVLRKYSYMNINTSSKPTEKELEILVILWEKGPVAVKEVHEALGGEETNGYTTILKLLQIMHEKGLVTRQKSGKLHLYKAVPSQENTRQLMLNKMIDKVFQGSAMQLVMSALGNKKSSKEELQEIKKYLETLEGGDQ
jgi:BlaI family penicillinase repressor